MRMKVWGEISGERHLVGTLETIPGREEPVLLRRVLS